MSGRMRRTCLFRDVVRDVITSHDTQSESPSRGRREISQSAVVILVVVHVETNAQYVFAEWRRHVSVHVANVQSKSPYYRAADVCFN